jgi:hypothetical protein
MLVVRSHCTPSPPRWRLDLTTDVSRHISCWLLEHTAVLLAAVRSHRCGCWWYDRTAPHLLHAGGWISPPTCCVAFLADCWNTLQPCSLLSDLTAVDAGGTIALHSSPPRWRPDLTAKVLCSRCWVRPPTWAVLLPRHPASSSLLRRCLQRSHKRVLKRLVANVLLKPPVLSAHTGQRAGRIKGNLTHPCVIC